MTDSEALRETAATLSQPGEFPGPLHTFRQGLKTEPRGDRDDRFGDRRVMRVTEDPRDEASIDLHDIDRDAFQERERGVSCAEIVDRDPHVEPAERATNPSRRLDISHG